MENESVETWAVEGHAPSVMVRTGWTRDTFKPGTRITVIGFLPRDVAAASGLSKALAYSPHAVDLLKTRHIIQAGEIRLDTGEPRRFGMGPAFSSAK